MGLERFAPVAVAVALGLGTAGCGLGGEAGVPADSDTTGLVGVMQTSQVRRGATTGTIRATGVEQLARRWSQLRTRWTRFGAIPAGRGESRWVDGRRYVSLPPDLRPGKRWLAWKPGDASRPIGSLGVFFVPDDLVQAGGPARALDKLDALGAVPQLLGRERLQGVDTTHYRATVLDDAAPGGTAEQVEVEVWVDSDAFARRLVTTTRRHGATVTTTSDFRPHARPQPPPRRPPDQEVVAADELAGG